ncbi:hypothetical protein GHV81_27945, partial [Pseudomonas aeruginosa]|nr:hypothetical protein [Pseudomonas aeruginosa]
MMHDALRADVLAAFVVQPGDGAAAEQVREDLQEHRGGGGEGGGGAPGGCAAHA